MVGGLGKFNRTAVVAIELCCGQDGGISHYYTIPHLSSLTSAISPKLYLFKTGDSYTTFIMISIHKLSIYRGQTIHRYRCVCPVVHTLAEQGTEIPAYRTAFLVMV